MSKAKFKDTDWYKELIDDSSSQQSRGEIIRVDDYIYLVSILYMQDMEEWILRVFERKGLRTYVDEDGEWNDLTLRDRK